MVATVMLAHDMIKVAVKEYGNIGDSRTLATSNVASLTFWTFRDFCFLLKLERVEQEVDFCWFLRCLRHVREQRCRDEETVRKPPPTRSAQ